MLSDAYFSTFFSGANRIFGNVCLQMTHTKVVRAVQNATVSVASAVDHVAVAFSSCNVHYRAVELLSDQGFGSFGTEVAEEHY